MNKKILVILTTQSEMTLTDGTRYPTGFFINEVYTPMYHWRNSGFDLSVATKDGTKPVLDQNSTLYMSKVKLKDALAFFETSPDILKPLSLQKLDDKKLLSYDAVYIPGSYAAIQELSADPGFKKVLRHFHLNKKLIITLSQSVYLLSVLNEDFEKEGWRPQVSCFPKEREEAVETVNFKARLPFYVETELQDMHFEINNTSNPLKPNVITDKHIMTGQDFYSAPPITRLVIKLLTSKKGLDKLKE